MYKNPYSLPSPTKFTVEVLKLLTPLCIMTELMTAIFVCFCIFFFLIKQISWFSENDGRGDVSGLESKWERDTFQV